MDDEALFRTGLHESGHALVAVLMRRRIAYVTVRPARGTLGRTVFAERYVVDGQDHRQVEREAALALAGFVAELIYDPTRAPTGCTEDVERAWRLTRALGHSEARFTELVWRTTKMLMAVWPCVLATATELCRRKQLNGCVVRRLIQRELGLRHRWSRDRTEPQHSGEHASLADRAGARRGGRQLGRAGSSA